MSDLVIIAVPNIGPIALTPVALREALAKGRELLGDGQASPAPAAPPAPALLDAAQVATATGVSAGWWMAAAREHRVPHQRIGRRVRFVLEEVLACDAVRRKRSLPSALVNGLSIRRASPSV